MTTTTITPFLWFNNTVPQAVEFYKSVFPDTKVEMVSDFMAVFVLQGQRFYALSVLCWMLADTVAVLGLLAFFLLHARTAALGFVAGAAALLVLQAPRIGALRPSPTSQDLARRPGPL